MALLRFKMKARTRSWSQDPTRATAYLLREGEYAPKHPEVAYLNRTSDATQERGDLVWSSVQNLPSWAGQDAAKFFSAAAEHVRSNGRYAYAMQASLPRELALEQQIALTQDFLQAHLADKPYLVVIHAPRTATGELQPHVHVLMSDRSLDNIERDEFHYFKRADKHQRERGGQAVDRFFSERRCPKRLRQAWADYTNLYLERGHHEARVDARSLRARDVDRDPERKGGWKHDELEARQQDRMNTEAQEHRLAFLHWETRKVALGIESVHELSPEAMREKSQAAVRGGGPGKALPPLTLEVLQGREAALVASIQQQEKYVERLQVAIVAEKQRERSGWPRTAQVEAQIERLIAGIEDDAPRQGATVRLMEQDMKTRGWGASWTEQARTQERGFAR